MENIDIFLKNNNTFELLNKYAYEDEHVHEKKVTIYALMIFDLLNKDMLTVFSHRNMLKYSSFFHDLGRFINKKNHHKHTRYIILYDKYFDCLPYNLRSMLSLIAGGHKKSIDKDIKYHDLHEQQIIMKLTSILRIADALDNRHNKNIAVKKIEVTPTELIIFMQEEDLSKISRKLHKKSALFKEYYNKEAVLKPL
ncbi:guanosine-5'-triphosphate,3'-diphosphate pyrophosphatase [Oxobacter pfennigii]|uniref:Guanosine-5'-triphosphate,3'-diphosphate pyrophosphatase n=1 Tax=Oxobacter pfennigii TaxID=36849 RepID=A0A0P8W420_9CLOT|nr:hypothetical protein [Oxobacter pfennigii]KPU42362.1 guanosine-5'-triphosphate,3'-diphosphate pyrophosphatase [Oxobacter pfennigii]